MRRGARAVAAHATVITRAALEQSGVEYVAEALRTAPGVVVVRAGSFGAVTSVFMRGGESDYVQVLVDGVAVNRPGGSFDFSTLTTENIERIEIIRGPVSAVYGSDAVSGVIQIFTRRGANAPNMNFSAQTGSYGTRLWEGALSGGSDALSYSVGVGGASSDGILEYNNQYRRSIANARVQAHLDPATDATVALRYADNTFHYPTDGSGQLVDRNAHTFGDDLSLHLDVARRWTDGLETRLSYQVHDYDFGASDESDDAADTLGFFGRASLTDSRRNAADLRTTWRTAGDATATFGYELEHQSVRAFSRSLSQYGTSASDSDDERANQAGYAQLSWRPGGLAVDGGVRVESNERFGTAATWRTGLAWRMGGSGSRLRVSAGTGIKEPTFFETYATGFTQGNPDLRPERSVSMEAGLDQALGPVHIAATAFHQSYEDLIQYTFAPPQPGGPNYYNVAKARSRGMELEARVDGSRVNVTGNYTFLATRVEDSGFDEGSGATFVEGEALIRRPKHMWSATVAARPAQRIDLSGTVRRTGERGDRDFSTWPAGPVVLPSYTVVNLSVNLDVIATGDGNAGMTLTLRAENLLDERYYEVFGFRAPGRGVYVGARVGLAGSR